MTPVNEYIIKVGSAFKETVTLGDMDLYIDPTYDQTRHAKRMGVITHLPSLGDKYDIEVGDEIVFIHTILLKQSYKQYQEDSVYLVDREEGTYRLPKDCIVMYRKPGGQWNCYGKYLMVTPIEAKEDDYELREGLVLTSAAFKSDVGCNTNGYIPQEGHIRYMNNELAEQGAEIGDRVYFRDFGNYEYRIEGETLFCMDNNDVVAILPD